MTKNSDLLSREYTKTSSKNKIIINEDSWPVCRDYFKLAGRLGAVWRLLLGEDEVCYIPKQLLNCS